MLRAFASALWVIVAIAFGFEAVAQPCDLRMELQAQTALTAEADISCHDGMMMSTDKAPAEAPEHQKDACCCAALLTNIVTLDGVDLTQPIPGITVWATPLPDSANSISFEYEPPPPRA